MKQFSVAALGRELDPGRDAETPGLCVAYSGGLDSTVLLTALADGRGQRPVGALRAIHVDHGLHADAPAWAEACAARCAQLRVPLDVLHVDARPRRGESPEARARELRYAALSAALAPGEMLLTAHHADDQLETLMIQMLRGAGPAGLAAMPRRAAFGPGVHVRPLLPFTRAALAAWARERGLRDWVEDPANAIPAFARNHLRREVLPAVRAHWPAAAAAAARTARHCAEAAGLLDDLAAQDATGCVAAEALVVAAMQELSSARRRNLVRWQCARLGLATPDERRLGSLLEQVFGADEDRQPEVRWPGVVARREAGKLWLLPAASLAEQPVARTWADPFEPLELGAGLGRLRLAPSHAGGLDPAALAMAPWRVSFRRGGERLQLPGQAGSRSLKKLLNEAGLPSWWRARMPLLEVDGGLAAVGDRWIGARWWHPPGGVAWRLAWEDCTLPGHETFIVGGQGFC